MESKVTFCYLQDILVPDFRNDRVAMVPVAPEELNGVLHGKKEVPCVFFHITPAHFHILACAWVSCAVQVPRL